MVKGRAVNQMVTKNGSSGMSILKDRIDADFGCVEMFRIVLE